MSTKLPLSERVAGAPISWGVCEAPGWGYEIAVDRVLDEMHSVGLRATELGPAGYLGASPADVVSLLNTHDLKLIGGFVPVPMHLDRNLDLTEATNALDILAAGRSEVAVFAAQSGDGSYDRKVNLPDHEWSVLLHNLVRLQQLARDRGLTPTLHPHVGTAIEDRESVQRLIAESDIPLCLDTGHLLIGGTEPLELLEQAADRVAHVHLKDVNRALATAVRNETLTYMDAVRQGLYTPLGKGDIDITGCVRALEAAAFQGWYVLEQDCALAGEPPAGDGPVGDVRTSVAYLADIER